MLRNDSSLKADKNKVNFSPTPLAPVESAVAPGKANGKAKAKAKVKARANSKAEDKSNGSTRRTAANGRTLGAKRHAAPEELEERFRSYLGERGLTPEDARHLKLKLYTKERAARELPGLPVYYDGFRIPYFDASGAPTGAWCYRYLLRATGFAALTGKRWRYASPKGSELDLYLPPFCDWAALVRDPAKPLIITEGPIKAAVATKAGHPTIGLAGVSCYRSARRGLFLLPAFDSIALPERTVYIAYDSDAATNLDAVREENRLAKLLLDLGAFPYIVRLPALEKDKKTGLDDYLVARGPEALKQLLKKAVEFDPAKELFALNEEVVYIKDLGVIVRHENNSCIKPHAFVEHAYSDRIYHEQRISAKGRVTLVEKKAPRAWLDWPHRAVLERIVYRPGCERVTPEHELNLWPGWGRESKKGNTRPFHQLWKFLTRDEKEILPWILDWLAYPLQRPGTKLYTCLSLWGRVHGTGKSLAGYIMKDIYGENFREIGNKQLFARFNKWAAEKQFIMGTEINSKGHRDAGDILKSIITQEQVLVEPKYIDEYAVRDCNNYYFTSNHPDALFIEDTDRRFVVVEVVGDPLPQSFYQELSEWRAAGGASHVFYELLRRDLSNFDPHAPAPPTRAKREMIADSRSDIAHFVAQLRDPDFVIIIAGQICAGSLFKTKELLHAYDPLESHRVTENGLARELRAAGFRLVARGQQIAREKKGVRQVLGRLWAIRNAEEMLRKSPQALFDQYTRELDQRGKNDAEAPATPGSREE
jgi:hypothetical protein